MDRVPLHESLSPLQLGDLLPAEDASAVAAARYHSRAKPGQDAGAAVAAAADHSWIPRRVESKEQMEEVVQLVQERMREFYAQFVQVQQLQAQQQAATDAKLAAAASMPSRSISPPPRLSSPPSQPPSISNPFPSSPASLSQFPPAPPVPAMPSWTAGALRSPGARLRALQSYLRAYEYNHLGAEFVDVSRLKAKNWDRLVLVAKDIVREALPIKCLEAVVLSSYISAPWDDMVRFPLRFKTRSGGHSYWHIVLAVQCEGKYGSVGLSRRSTLDYRPLIFPSLSSLADSFRQAYSEVGHEVHYLTAGLAMPRKELAQDRVFWHFFMIPVWQPPPARGKRGEKEGVAAPAALASTSTEWGVVLDLLDRFARAAPKLSETMRKAAASASAAATGAQANCGSGGGGGASQSALFVPPATLKIACGVAPTAPLLSHPNVHYDSALVALVYRPGWAAAQAAAAAASGGKKGKAKACAGGSGSDSSSDEEETGAATNSSGGSEDDDDGHCSSSSSEEAPATARGGGAVSELRSSLPLPSMRGRAAEARARRVAERAERRRNKLLVAALKDRYRHPHVHTHAPAALASPLSSPSSAGAKKKALLLQQQQQQQQQGQQHAPPTHSPVRSPQFGGGNGGGGGGGVPPLRKSLPPSLALPRSRAATGSSAGPAGSMSLSLSASFHASPTAPRSPATAGFGSGSVKSTGPASARLASAASASATSTAGSKAPKAARSSHASALSPSLSPSPSPMPSPSPSPPVARTSLAARSRGNPASQRPTATAGPASPLRSSSSPTLHPATAPTASASAGTLAPPSSSPWEAELRDMPGAPDLYAADGDASAVTSKGRNGS